MEKNWLIRTKSNHILGPVSKEKVLELYKNGSIKPDDEVCSGNGFWFFIREDDMVARYLLGNDIQSFNPISEAKDVLTSSEPKSAEAPEAVKDDITLVGGIDLSMLNQTPAPAGPEELPSVVEETTTPPLPGSAPVTPAAGSPKKKPKLEVKADQSAKASSSKPLKKQSYLKYLGILGFLLLFILVYFRKTIIRSLFEGEMTSVTHLLLAPAYAQDDVPAKKKSF